MQEVDEDLVKMLEILQNIVDLNAKIQEIFTDFFYVIGSVLVLVYSVQYIYFKNYRAYN